MEKGQLQAAFIRHWEAFLKEVDELADTPENREKINEAVKAVLGDNRKAIGLGAVIAQHWEPLISRLLSGIKSEAKKAELIEAFQRLLLEQITEFSRILASDDLDLSRSQQ